MSKRARKFHFRQIFYSSKCKELCSSFSPCLCNSNWLYLIQFAIQPSELNIKKFSSTEAKKMCIQLCRELVGNVNKRRKLMIELKIKGHRTRCLISTGSGAASFVAYEKRALTESE
jgi:hypothetical protein